MWPQPEGGQHATSSERGSSSSATLFVATGATAQNTNGTISGHVVDSQGLPLPGVTVNATSPNLQGVRTVTSSTNGDYIFSLLPSGTYTVTFELSGFQPQTEDHYASRRPRSCRSTSRWASRRSPKTSTSSARPPTC